MSKPTPLFPSRLLTALLLLVAATCAGSYLRVAVPRVLYPYDLDFIEDGMLMQAWQVAQGQPVFVPPNADFVPHVYMPLYTWLGGQLFKLTGPAFWPLRLLSLCAILATAALIFFVARKESGDRPLGLFCAALFLAGYRLAGGSYELARVDALFVFLALAGVTLALYGTSSDWGLIGSGLLLGLAFLTKQHGLLVALAAAGYLLIRGQTRAWLLLLVFGLASAIPLLVIQQTSNGWFAYYVVDVAYASPLSERGRLMIGMLVLGGIAAMGLSWWRGRWAWLRQQPWILFVGTAIFISVSGLASVGGNLNNVIPGYAFLCLLPAIAAKELSRWPPKGPAAARAMLPPALLALFALTVFNPISTPRQFVPTAAMREAGDALIQQVAAIDGDVWIMMHPFYALLAGKTPSAQVQALWHARLRGQKPLPPDLVSRIETQQYAVIVSDNSQYFETEPALVALIEAHYRIEGMLQEAPQSLSGMITRPQIIYVPRER